MCRDFAIGDDEIQRQVMPLDAQTPFARRLRLAKDGEIVTLGIAERTVGAPFFQLRKIASRLMIVVALP